MVGQHARFVMSMFMGQKVDVEINVNETPQVKARNDALDYLAQKMAAIGGNPENVVEAPILWSNRRRKHRMPL